MKALVACVRRRASVRRLERDPDVVGRDLETGGPEVTEHLQRRGASVEVQGVARLDQGCRGRSDQPFLGGVR
jgi:hypothetical protein